MNHLQVASGGAGLVLEVAEVHVGPPVTPAHLLLAAGGAVRAVRLVAGEGADPGPLALDRVGVHIIVVGVVANTVMDFLSTIIKYLLHLETSNLDDAPGGAHLVPQLALVSEGHVGRPGPHSAHRGEDLGAGFLSVTVSF